MEELLLFAIALFIFSGWRVKAAQQFFDETVHCQELGSDCEPSDSDIKDDSPPGQDCDTWPSDCYETPDAPNGEDYRLTI